MSTAADDFAVRVVWAGECVDLVDEINPSYDPVLRYLMKRGFTRCRYEKGARILVAGTRDGTLDPSLAVAGHRYTREEVVPPGLARYRAR